jgi:hypothetical protein
MGLAAEPNEPTPLYQSMTPYETLSEPQSAAGPTTRDGAEPVGYARDVQRRRPAQSARLVEETDGGAHQPAVQEAPRPSDRVRFGAPRPPELTSRSTRPGDARFEPSVQPGSPPSKAVALPREPAPASDAGQTQPGGTPGQRVVLEQVEVVTHGLDATVEVRLSSAGVLALGVASGPAVDGYVLRLCATAAAGALDDLLLDPATGLPRGRCFVEHAAVVPFGGSEVAVVVVLLMYDGWVEQLAGSSLVAGDARQAMVRATLAAVNRRLEALFG